ncbi:EAL domain-containing protein [Algibacillus agarilyticus]|uniref:EAL domain-containing protein n=1 Tax=Algibacillus agarilyticus TaxID=2234133 RepID=UPI000DCFF07E|nr:EAL domain-containing protein [Algibacillus agarilyticus]
MKNTAAFTYFTFISRIILFIYCVFNTANLQAADIQWKHSIDERWQQSAQQSLKVNSVDKLELSIAPAPDILYLVIENPRVKLTIDQRVEYVANMFGQVIKLQPNTAYHFQLTAPYTAYTTVELLNAEQLVSQQQHEAWIWGVICSVLVVLAMYAIISGNWWQQTMHYWFLGLVIAALSFISIHSGMIQNWLKLPNAVLSSGLYHFSMVLMTLCFVGITKSVLTFKCATRAFRQLFNIVISLLAVVSLACLFVPLPFGYYLALSFALLSALICTYSSLVAKPDKKSGSSQRGYTGSWVIFSIMLGAILISSVLPLSANFNYLLPAVITLHIFTMALILAERQVGMLKQTLSVVNHRRKQGSSLQYAALHDKLTGLPNQLALETYFMQVIKKHNSSKYALVLLKLKNFETLNHNLGYSTGDMVIVQMARRLNRLLAERAEVVPLASNGTDEQLCLAALSGVTYAFVLDVTEQKHVLEYLALELRQQLPDPIALDALVIENDISMGAAYFPADGDNFDTLLNSAHTALEFGVVNNQLLSEFTPDQEPISIEQRELAAELKEALKQDQLQLMIQPVVEINYKKIVAGEILIRWRHPEKGLIQPNDFIHLAEKTGAIYGITRWVIKSAVEALVDWRKQSIDAQVSVNISNRDLLQHELIDYIADLLKQHDIPANKLVLEINENALTSDTLQAHDALLRLHKLGVHTVIDDFGTGITSLSLIRKLPLNGVKIDRAFVQSLMEGETAKTIVNTVIDIGRNLELDVIAEGVEDLELEDKLRRMGCNLTQGFLYSKPFALEGFVSWVQQWEKSRSSTNNMAKKNNQETDISTDLQND